MYVVVCNILLYHSFMIKLFKNISMIDISNEEYIIYISFILKIKSLTLKARSGHPLCLYNVYASMYSRLINTYIEKDISHHILQKFPQSTYLFLFFTLGDKRLDSIGVTNSPLVKHFFAVNIRLLVFHCN
jgi:hypothetical protein